MALPAGRGSSGSVRVAKASATSARSMRGRGRAAARRAPGSTGGAGVRAPWRRVVSSEPAIEIGSSFIHFKSGTLGVPASLIPGGFDGAGSTVPAASPAVGRGDVAGVLGVCPQQLTQADAARVDGGGAWSDGHRLTPTDLSTSGLGGRHAIAHGHAALPRVPALQAMRQQPRHPARSSTAPPC